MVRETAAGPCHDLGKICVPLHILKKTDPLTREERDILEHHAAAGFVLLCYYLKDKNDLAARVALNHHERRNGSGYPGGIKHIDRLVEIVAVCDIYDALVSQRPYRPISYDNRTALEEITLLAEKGEISWEGVKALISHNRRKKPHYSQVAVSIEKRGSPPLGSVYGVIAA
jgi:HD-GYP domain-containing protein (c-di-GMP phosphodiesterase class II)